MQLFSRLLDKSDYETLVSWWDDWNFQPPTREMLPDLGLGGVMVFNEDDTPICAGFLYETNSCMGWCEYIVSNKKFKEKDKRAAALTFLISSISGLAKKKGLRLLFTSTKHPSLTKRYLDAGFLKGDDSVELIKAL